MAAKAIIYKVDLQISDMDRHYYAAHALTLAQHPSETAERLMVRLLAFALNAHEFLVFGKGFGDEEESDLWQKDLTGVIDLWIEIGQPDEQRIRRACGRARQVIVYTYSGRSADIWWEKIAPALERSKNLTVIDFPAASAQQIAALANRNMQLQCLIQDGQIQLISDTATVALELTTRRSPIGMNQTK